MRIQDLAFSQLMQKRVFYGSLVISYMSLIFYLSSIPGEYIATKISVSDKILHIIEFFILAVLLYMWFNISGNKTIKENKYFLAIIITIIYGISDEFHQFFVHGRAADILDVLADSIGAIAVSILAVVKNVLRKIMMLKHKYKP